MNSLRTTRKPIQQLSLAGAVLFGAIPLALGVVRARTTGDDYRMFWMAMVCSIFAAGVLLAAVGRRRSRRAALFQGFVILLVGTIVAVGVGYMLGATSVVAVLGVSFGLSLCLAISSVLVAFSRAT